MTALRPGHLLVLSAVVLLVAALAGLAVGSRGLSAAVLLETALGRGDVESAQVLHGLRGPRTLSAALGGAALAVAGAVVQAHTRNPLADPGLLGISAGAAVAVVLAISLLGVNTPEGHRWFAVGGAAVATGLVAVVAAAAGGRSRDPSPATLVLAGSALSALLGAITGLVLLLDADTLETFRFWTVGSLAGTRGYAVLAAAAPLVLAGLVLAVLHGPAMDALALGDDTARSLGRRLVGARLSGLAITTLLVAGAVTCCGGLGFVGLVVPHAVRRLTGPGHRWLLPQCALLGGALVVLADVAARLVVRPGELPVGLVLGLVGAPAFLLVLVRAHRRRP